MSKNIIILYHKNCDDGFGATWAAWKKFGNKAKYIGINPGDEPPKGLAGKDVYFLDVSCSPEAARRLLKITRSLTIIDHHISAKNIAHLIPNSLFNFDFTISGAVLAWKYFHPDKKVPMLLRYIQAQDLWHWGLPYAKEIMSALKLYDFDFEVWSKIAKDLENKKSIKKYINEGNILLTQRKIGTREALKDAIKVKFCGYTTFAVNTRSAVSEIGAVLYKKLPPIAIVWSVRGDKIVVSLRSNGKADVSKLAARFGGGGHKVSAAFRLPVESKFPWKIIK